MIKVKGVDAIQFFTYINDIMYALYIIKDFSLKKKTKFNFLSNPYYHECITTMTL